MAAQGTDIWLVAGRQEVREEVAKHAQSLGSRGHVCSLDLTCDEDVYNLGKRLEREVGHLNILVLCGGTIVQFSLADLDLMYCQSPRLPRFVAGHAAPLAQGEGSDRFCQFHCRLALRCQRCAVLGNTARISIHGDTLREEVNADEIRVLGVYLGRVATPRTEQTFAKERRPYKPELLVQPEDVAEMVIHSLRLPRTAEVTDMTIRAMLKSY